MQLNKSINITPNTPEVKKEIENICRYTLTRAETVLKVLDNELYLGDETEPYYIAEWFISRFRYEMRWNFNKHKHKLI